MVTLSTRDGRNWASAMQAVDKLHASPWSDADLERRSRIRLYQRMNRVLCGNLQWDLENAMG